MTPPPMNVSNHPTGPLRSQSDRAAQVQRVQNAQQMQSDTARQRAVMQQQPLQTDPARQRPSVMPSSLQEDTGRHRAVMLQHQQMPMRDAMQGAMPPVASDVRDINDEDFELDDEAMSMSLDMESTGEQLGTTGASHDRLPGPEPEAQPLQRPSVGQQRPVRRLDRGADVPRGGRNAPSGDVIDIPAFLRKR